jgi:spore germination protein YaaH
VEGFDLRLHRTLVFAALMFAGWPAVAQPRALFYMSDGAASVHSFEAHRDKIDILVPTWYSVDASGLVAGGPNNTVLREAKAAHIAVIPIVAMFDKDGAHKLFGDTKAQAEMNAALVRECKANGYAGIQFDLENISWTDRDGLTALVASSAATLHREGLQIQIATVPNAPGHPGNTEFGRWIFEDWRGVYDLKALAASVDLICLMTYDQHTRWTVPGPVGGWGWTRENLRYALQFVPREKLSLGIALYGYHWYTGNPGLGKTEQKPNPTADYISAPDALYLRDTFHGQQQWDPIDHAAFFWFYRDQMREWIFYTDKQTFEDRYELVKEQGLEGFCSWVLGEEDPSIWTVLPSRT